MTQDNKVHINIITDCLTKMNVNPVVASYQVLQEGISGSHVYRIQLATDTVILKVALAKSEPYVFQRAQREFNFYRTLAGRIPLTIPCMLSYYTDDDFGICILFAAYQPSGSPKAWQEEDYLEVAKQLASFHALFWKKTEELSEFPWLRKPSLGTDSTQIQRAYDAWRHLSGQRRLRDVLAAQSFQSLYSKFEHIPTIDAIIHSFPMTLCHGDCHIGNLLRDSQGNLIWADWQEVGLGRGPEDVSFLLQRALFAGGVVASESVIKAYQEHIEVQTGEEISLTAIKRVVDSAELRMQLLHWPFYLKQAPVEQISNMLDRIEMLAKRL